MNFGDSIKASCSLDGVFPDRMTRAEACILLQVEIVFYFPWLWFWFILSTSYVCFITSRHLKTLTSWLHHLLPRSHLLFIFSIIPSFPSAETHNFDSVSSTAPYTPNSDSSIDSPLHTPTLPVRTSSRLVKPPSYLQLSFQLSLFFASIRSDFC